MKCYTCKINDVKQMVLNTNVGTTILSIDLYCSICKNIKYDWILIIDNVRTLLSDLTSDQALEVAENNLYYSLKCLNSLK